MRTRVKICGITRIEDGRAAVAAGADAIGLVFDPRSPRAVTIEQALSITKAMPPFVTVVGLFVDAAPEMVRDASHRANLSLLQFHGNETPELCRSFDRPYIKAISMREGVDLRAEENRFRDAVGLLLDTFTPDKAGGSGQTFDWSRVPSQRAKPVILAGGLTPDNVGEAIRRVRPDAVDVSSGVELAKGIKDPNKISAFIKAVQNAV